LPKGLQPVGGIRIIDRVASALRGVTPRLVLLSNTPEAGHWLPGVPVQRDVRPERGALVGIHTALMHARGPVLVVAWDMPFVTSELLEYIVGRAKRAQYAVVCEGRKGWEPCCAWYSTACLPLIDTMLVDSDARLGAFVERLPAVERIARSELVALDDPDRLFFNVNSPADLARAEQMAKR
jgi:molybdopterin-guanine dinucleotide biosynthesis protein A